MSTELEQLSDEWFEVRKGKVTGSRVAAILGHSPWMTRNSVMRELIREHQGLERIDKSNPATKWGNENEDIARAAYEAETGFLINTTGFHQHPDVDYIGVSPDGLHLDDGLERLLEIKCPYSRKIPSEVPEHYNDQVQLMLHTLDVAHCDLFYWTPEETHTFGIGMDPEWWDATLPVLQDFYDEFLSIRDEPLIEEVEVTDLGVLGVAAELVEIRARIALLKEKEKIVIDSLSKHVDSTVNTRMGAVVATHATRKGAINQKAMVKDGINIEKYRGKEVNYITYRIDK
jgi:putative phage-type endonuclease